MYSTPDLTIVGFLDPVGGIGQVPINIMETLGDSVSVNLISTFPRQHLEQELPASVMKALNNSDTSPGKVALLTDTLGDFARSPFKFMPRDSTIKLAYSMFETTKIPSQWVTALNEDFDAVIVPDEFLESVYENSGVKIPIFVLPIPMLLNAFFEHPVHPNTRSVPFVFGDASANKNPDVLVEAFAKAFGNNPDFHLVMRASGCLFQDTQDIITRISKQYGLTNVTMENESLLPNQYMDRLVSFDCYVNVSCGEGFSFIPREALALGVPVIITNNTVLSTICNSGFVRAIPSIKKIPPLPIYKNLYNDECGYQFACEVDDVVEALRDVYDHYRKYIKKARNGRDWVNRYNSANPQLQGLYHTLIKPKRVVLGNTNAIKNETLITNSHTLYNKYQQIVGNQ